MNGTIPEALLAIADEVVKMERLRVAPPKCEWCKPGDPCWWHSTFHSQEPRE